MVHGEVSCNTILSLLSIMPGVSGEVSEANRAMAGKDWSLHVVASFDIVCRM